MKAGNIKVVNTDIAIIGAGASGMMAALSVKSGAGVVLIEHNDRVGKKILSTGNGKCNLSHDGLSRKDYYGSGADCLEKYLERFGTAETIGFFEAIGLYIRNRDGYLYPYSETAASVLDVLRFEIEKRNTEIFTETETENIEIAGPHNFVIHCSGGIEIHSSRLIIASGGMAAPKSGSDGSLYKLLSDYGFDLVSQVPALVKVRSDSNLCKSLDGVRAKGLVRLVISGKGSDWHTAVSSSASDSRKYETGGILELCDSGEIQFTRDGLSGIPVFNLSRAVGYAGKKNCCRIMLDLLPDLDADILTEKAGTRLDGHQTAEQLLTGLINRKIMLAVLKIVNLSPEKICSERDLGQIRKFYETLKNLTFNITGTYGFDSAQVTAGGISFSEVDENLQSIRYPGLFFAGEILDIDGKCGGYNLQWAWTSGHIAGESAGLLSV